MLVLLLVLVLLLMLAALVVQVLVLLVLVLVLLAAVLLLVVLLQLMLHVMMPGHLPQVAAAFGEEEDPRKRSITTIPGCFACSSLHLDTERSHHRVVEWTGQVQVERCCTSRWRGSLLLLLEGGCLRLSWIISVCLRSCRRSQHKNKMNYGQRVAGTPRDRTRTRHLPEQGQKRQQQQQEQQEQRQQWPQLATSAW